MLILGFSSSSGAAFFSTSLKAADVARAFIYIGRSSGLVLLGLTWYAASLDTDFLALDFVSCSKVEFCRMGLMLEL